MGFNILYNDANPELDVVNLLTYINDFTKGLGEEQVTVDPDICYRIVQLMQQDFPHTDGIEKASVFKKIAHFMCYFIAEQPIKSSFKEENIGSSLIKVMNHSNAIVALHLAIACLDQAVILGADGNKQTLVNRITLSKHSYTDVVDALRNMTPSVHFKLLTVFLEQLAYKVNPNCQYDQVDL